MKKMIVSVFSVLLLQACTETKKESETEMIQQNETNRTENSVAANTPPAQRNEIIHEMNEMMDEMHKKQMSGNNDEDYAEMMSDHHDGAVKMSEIVIQKGLNEALKNFARNVVKTQKQEIALMDRFDDLKDKSANSTEFQEELKASMAAMMHSGVPVHNDVDRDYAEQMIPHHQSAVAMAKVYRKYGKQADLLKLSDNIIATQNKEIEFLRGWLSAN